MDKTITEETFIEVAEGKVFVKTWTPAIRELDTPLILLHDSLGCVDMWRDFPESLAEALKCQVIAYDRLGFGKSSERTELPSLRFVNEEAETVLPQILEHLGLRKVNLFGHSVGGGMAVCAAGTLPETIENVISESAQAFVEDRTLAGIRKAQAEFQDPKLFERLVKYHGFKAAWVLRAWTEIWLSEAFKNWNLKKELGNIKCPLLVIHGDRDEYGSLKFPDFMEAHSSGPISKHIIAECGHLPHREKKDEVLKIVVSFLKAKSQAV